MDEAHDCLVARLAEIYVADEALYRAILRASEERGISMRNTYFGVEIASIAGEVMMRLTLPPSTTIREVKGRVAVHRQCEASLVALLSHGTELDDLVTLAAYGSEKVACLTAVIKRVQTTLEILQELTVAGTVCVLISQAGVDINGVYTYEDEFRGNSRFVSSHPKRDVWLRIGTAGFWCLECQRDGYPGNSNLCYAWRKHGGPEGQWPLYQAGTVTVGPMGREPTPRVEAAADAIRRLQAEEEGGELLA